MPIFNNATRQILFIHIPKAAGTSIEEKLLQNGFSMTYRRGGRYGKLNDFDRTNGCSPQHMHGALLDRHFDPQSFDFVFTVVRNPLDRLVSEFNFRKTSMKAFDFDNFEDWTYHTLASFNSNPFVYDNHIRPQNEFIWGEAKIYKLEYELNLLFNDISNTTGTVIDSRIRNYMASTTYHKLKDVSGVARNLIEEFYINDFEYFGY